jgi:hypothetical protein
MREGLLPLVGARGRFRATVGFWGGTKGGTPKLLLEDVVWVKTGEYLAEHCWLRSTPEVVKANLQRGDRVEFSAWVRPYRRGSGSRDIGLEDMHRIVRRG